MKIYIIEKIKDKTNPCPLVLLVHLVQIHREKKGE